jgi:uncharacterized delta-60 repeat protein
MGSSGATQLSDLTDVDLTGLSNGDILVYDSVDSEWKRQAAPSGLVPTTVPLTNNTGPVNSGIPLPSSEGAYIDYSVIRELFADGVLDATYTDAASFNTKFNNFVYAVAIQSDGKVLIGGDFTNYGGFTNRSRLVRLNPDGTLDTAFCAAAVDSGQFGTGSGIRTIVVQPDGKILVGGGFTTHAGVTNRNRLVRLNSDGTTDAVFSAAASDSNKFSNEVWSIVVQPDNKVLVGGIFLAYGGFSGRNYLTRLNSDGTLDAAFVNDVVDGSRFGDPGGPISEKGVFSMVQNPDESIVIAGNYVNYNGVSGRSRLIKISVTGVLDATYTDNASFSNKFSAQIRSIARQSDGKIIVGGNFTNYGGSTGRDRLVRLETDGNLDTGFTTFAADGAKFNAIILAVTVQSDGKILVGGSFTNYNGFANWSRLVRLNTGGLFDQQFSDNFFGDNNLVRAVRQDSLGRVYVGGDFIDYGTIVGRNRFVRLQADGALISRNTATGRVHKAPISSTIVNAYTETGTSGVTWSLVSGNLHWTTDNQLNPTTANSATQGIYQAKVLKVEL